MVSFLLARYIASFRIVLIDRAWWGAGPLIGCHLIQALYMTTCLTLLGYDLNVTCIDGGRTKDSSDFLLTQATFLVLNLPCSFFELDCGERVRNCLHFEGCKHIFVRRELDAELLARLLNHLVPG